MEKYNVILADPPWSYDDKAHAGKRGVEYQYSTMTPKQIRMLPVESICATDCALFLWTTMPQVEVALSVLRAWGFTYKTVAFTWIKRTKNWKLAWGMGSWTRANPEMVLLGVKGKPKRIGKGVHSVVEAKVREHSRKPDEVRGRIVELVGDVPRVELFAREKTEGWSVWGDEVENDFEFRSGADLSRALVSRIARRK